MKGALIILNKRSNDMFFNCQEVLKAIKLDKSNADEYVQYLVDLMAGIYDAYKVRATDDGVEIYMEVSSGEVTKEVIVKTYLYGEVCVVSPMSNNLPANFSEEDFNKNFKCECGNPYCTVPDAQVKLSDSCNGLNCQCCSTTSTT